MSQARAGADRVVHDLSRGAYIASTRERSTAGGNERAVLAARLGRIPVLLDGYVSTAAAAPLLVADPTGLDHCLVAHLSVEPGHQRLAERLGKAPILDLAMRLGEGTGAVLAAGILRTAIQAHNGMATFADAGVSEKSD